MRTKPIMQTSTALGLIALVSLATTACFRDFNPPTPRDKGLVLTITAPEADSTVDQTPIEVRGTVDREATVTVNGAPATVTGLEFSATLALSLGQNVIIVDAVGVLDPTKTASASVTVTFTPPPPTITISAPSDGAIVSSQPVEVRGSVAVDADVTINGQSATMDGRNFSLTQALAIGDNVITIVATDRLYPSNTDTKSITVTFTPPPPTITIEAPLDGETLVRMPVEVRGRGAGPAARTGNGPPPPLDGQSFIFSLPLVFGSNTITVIATDTVYPTNSDSRVITVDYAPYLPTITLDELVDGDVVHERPLLVTGTVAIAAIVTVNGVEATMDGLSFSAVVPLQLGTNTLEIIAVDATDPANSSTLSLAVSFPPLTVQVDNSIVAGDGAFEIVPRDDGTAILSGTYAPTDYPIGIELVSGALTQTLSSSDGTFRAILPASPDDWTLTVTEVAPEPRSVVATVRAAADVTAPAFTIDGGLVHITPDEVYVLSGRAVDAQSTVTGITAASSRHPGVAFAVIIGGGGGFYVELPIERGDNVITLRAVDQFGNATEVEVRIVRPSGIAPTLVVTAPTPGDVVTTRTIAVEGFVYSNQPPGSVRVLAGDQMVFTEATAREGVLSFRIEAVALREGYNALWVRAESLVGTDETTIPIVYLADAPPPNDTRPIIVVVAPLPGAATNDPSITLSGSVLRGEGNVTLEIDGVVVPLFGEQRRFRHTVDISSRPAGVMTFALTATDSQSQIGTATVRVTKDLGIPVITITSPGIEDPPAVNRVVEVPFPLEGTVRDDNLGSLTLNGEPVRVLPGAEADLYTFSVRVALTNGEQRTATLVASDRAGNRSTRSLEFLADVPVRIEIVAPQSAAELMASGATLQVDTVARLTGLTAEHRVRAFADEAAPIDLALAGSTASGAVTCDATDGTHRLTLEVVDASDVVVARARTGFIVVNADNIPLQVVSTVPANGATGVEPNAFVTLHFNKPIDPSLLSLEVRETAHGPTYDLSQGQGADFTSRSLPPLVDVHRDQEPVGASPSLFPGNRMIAYYLARDLAYGGKAFLTVTYDGQELTRFGYDTRPLPTFVQGLVSDQFLTEVAGVAVALPALGRTAVTDANGSFAFGFGDPPDQTLPPGRQRLVINPNLANRRFGSVELWVNIEAGRLSQVGTTPLPILNPDVPFRRLASGAAGQLFAEGALTLDASGAALRFPDGRNQGDIHVQFTPVHQLPATAQAYAAPQWMYAVQPVGIELRGRLSVRVQMPALYGSHQYVPADGTKVVLLGFDASAMQLVPAGVGTITANTVEGVIENTRLDFLGYALMEARHQGVLEQYLRGEITLQQLNGALAGAAP